MYILCLYVYMVEETMAQLVDGALCAVLVKREILVGVEHYYVVEAESCLVAADKLLVDRVQRQTHFLPAALARSISVSTVSAITFAPSSTFG